MKHKRYIVCFFMLVSLILVIAETIPHHHHSDGAMCMKDDLRPEDCCDAMHHHHEENDPCCSSDCQALFNTTTPVVGNDETQPEFVYSIILFSEPLLRLLTQPEENIFLRGHVFVESLHGTYITRAAGLRAPPCES